MTTATGRDRYRAIKRLRAVRSFTDDPVDRETLDAVLDAARWTGSSKNRQLWSFVVVDGADQRERLAETGDFTKPVLAAPVTIAIVQEPGGYEFDSGRVAQNVMLAADALALGTCPVTLHREDDAAAVLGLPEGARCRYAVALGHPGEAATPAVAGGRKPIEELTHHNTYGTPFPQGPPSQ